MGDEVTDSILMNLASRTQSIDGLLSAMLGFLHRKTDFYVVDDSPSRRMGFASGEAKKKLLAAFEKFSLKRVAQEKASEETKSAKAEGPAAQDTTTGKTQDKTVGGAGSSSVRLTKEGKQIPISNGGVGPGYWWTQTLAETSISIPLPEGTRARDIDCRITPSGIRVQLKGQASPLLTGEFEGKVKDSMWTIEGGTISIILEKMVQTWWVSAVKGHPEIDATMVDSTKRIDEYDEETQAAIRRILIHQNQKAMGLPVPDDPFTAEAPIPPPL